MLDVAIVTARPAAMTTLTRPGSGLVVGLLVDDHCTCCRVHGPTDVVLGWGAGDLIGRRLRGFEAWSVESADSFAASVQAQDGTWRSVVVEHDGRHDDCNCLWIRRVDPDVRTQPGAMSAAPDVCRSGLLDAHEAESAFQAMLARSAGQGDQLALVFIRLVRPDGQPVGSTVRWPAHVLSRAARQLPPRADLVTIIGDAIAMAFASCSSAGEAVQRAESALRAIADDSLTIEPELGVILDVVMDQSQHRVGLAGLASTLAPAFSSARPHSVA